MASINVEQDRQAAIQWLESDLVYERTCNAAGMIFELYRDKILTSYQVSEALVAMGANVAYSGTTGELIGYYL